MLCCFVKCNNYNNEKPLKKMKKSYYALSLFLLTAIFAFTCCTGMQKKKQNISEKPNIIFILADDLGWAEMNKKKTNELYQLLEEWRKDTKAELPVENPDFNPEKRYLWGKHPDRAR